MTLIIYVKTVYYVRFDLSNAGQARKMTVRKKQLRPFAKLLYLSFSVGILPGSRVGDSLSICGYPHAVLKLSFRQKLMQLGA